MIRFSLLTLLGVSALCTIGSIHQASAQSSPLIDVNALVRILDRISSSGDGDGGSGSSARRTVLNINLIVQLLNGLLARGSSGTVSQSTLTNICNQSCTPPPSSSRNNSDSLIAIRLIIQILNTIANAGESGSGDDGSNDSGSLLSVNAIINLLNSIAGSSSSSGGGGWSSGGRNTSPLIGIDNILKGLNSYRTSRRDGGNRYCHVGEFNQRLQSEARNSSRTGSGSVLTADDILRILNQVTYRPTRQSARNNNLIQVNILIRALNQLLRKSEGGRGLQTGNDALVSLNVCVSLLNNTSKTGSLGGLVINLLRNLLGGILGGHGGLLGGASGGLLGGLLGGPSGLGGVLSGLLGGLLG